MVGQIKTEAKKLGFSHCGIARAGTLEHLRPFYTRFLEEGREETFRYLRTSFEKRLDPSLLLPGIKSVIALLMNYYPGKTAAGDQGYVISKYALGADRYPIIKQRMEVLAGVIRQFEPGAATRLFVDSSPVPEKAWAQRCGVGWQGKNTLIINKTSGSYHFIGIILTDLELEPDPPETDHCGACNRCRDACPTGALDEPYQLNIGRCISYHTIEQKGEIPPPIKSNLQGRIFGCDICQDVCPWNSFATPATDPDFQPSPAVVNLGEHDWKQMTEGEFNRVFDGSAIKRTGFRKLMKNAGLGGDCSIPGFVAPPV
jgi:epoxyqueuosine reductase